MNGYTIAGIILIIVAILAIIIGIYLYNKNIDENQDQTFTVWFLIGGGIILGLLGLFALGFGLSSGDYDDDDLQKQVALQQMPQMVTPQQSTRKYINQTLSTNPVTGVTKEESEYIDVTQPLPYVQYNQPQQQELFGYGGGSFGIDKSGLRLTTPNISVNNPQPSYIPPQRSQLQQTPGFPQQQQRSRLLTSTSI